MRIHSNVLMPSDLQVALNDTGLSAEGVHLDTASVHRSTKRGTGIEFRLSAQPGRDRFGKARRPRNTGQWGAEQSGGYDKGATYDEHGVWMARLFEIDPDAIVGPYDGVDKFHEMTRYEYA
jgi:hypothetical protein